MKRCEFRASELSGLEGVQSLRGAAMQWPDIVGMAGVWAGALGIEIFDGGPSATINTPEREQCYEHHDAVRPTRS